QVKILDDDRVFVRSRTLLNWIKRAVRRNRATWTFGKLILSSSFLFRNQPKRIFEFLDADALVLNAGSGTTRLKGNVVNLDILDEPEVDVIAELSALPFRDASIEGIICMQVLEHCHDPQAAIREFRRV